VNDKSEARLAMIAGGPAIEKRPFFTNYLRNQTKLFPKIYVTYSRQQREVFMVLQLENMPKVEALRTYPAGTLDRLAQLLAMGVSAKADPRRECFYEVESDSEVFYVHISPVNGRVLLIGIWPKSAISAMSIHATQAA
jgi:hypothetical protein